MADQDRNISADFSGRRALVTGASSGIGRATVLALAAAGTHVVAAGRRVDALEAVRNEATGMRGAVETVAADVNDADDVAAMAERAGAVDILVNGAGFAKHTPFLDGAADDWQAIFDTNVLSVLRVSQAIARGMKARGRGHIFNISSILADRVYPYTMVYAASKHAVRGLCRGMRVELAPFGIKVTEIAPGLVETAILSNTDHPDVLAAYAARGYAPLQPDDIAGAIVDAATSGPNACPELIAINPMGQI